MPASRIGKFVRTLGRMWDCQSAELLRRVGVKRKGRRARFTRTYREKKLNLLLDLAEKASLPKIKKWVRTNTKRRSIFFNKGLRGERKYETLEERLGRERRHPNLVYIFWGGHRKCPKVGRSDKGLQRLEAQRDHKYFRDARRITLFFSTRKKKSTLPALECALTHLYAPSPSYTRVKPARRKFRQECFVCNLQHDIKSRIRTIFPVPRGRHK